MQATHHQIHLASTDLIRGRLAAGATLRFTVAGYSMLPTIRPGDTILVTKTDPDQLQPGDIVLCATERAFLAHRLIATRRQAGETWLTTRGDNTSYPDPACSAERLVGKVTHIERSGGAVDVASWRRQMAQRLIKAGMRRESTILQRHGVPERAPGGRKNRRIAFLLAKALHLPSRLGVKLATWWSDLILR